MKQNIYSNESEYLCVLTCIGATAPPLSISTTVPVNMGVSQLEVNKLKFPIAHSFLAWGLGHVWLHSLFFFPFFAACGVQNSLCLLTMAPTSLCCLLINVFVRLRWKSSWFYNPLVFSQSMPASLLYNYPSHRNAGWLSSDWMAFRDNKVFTFWTPGS